MVAIEKMWDEVDLIGGSTSDFTASRCDHISSHSRPCAKYQKIKKMEGVNKSEIGFV